MFTGQQWLLTLFAHNVNNDRAACCLATACFCYWVVHIAWLIVCIPCVNLGLRLISPLRPWVDITLHGGGCSIRWFRVILPSMIAISSVWMRASLTIRSLTWSWATFSTLASWSRFLSTIFAQTSGIFQAQLCRLTWLLIFWNNAISRRQCKLFGRCSR